MKKSRRCWACSLTRRFITAWNVRLKRWSSEKLGDSAWLHELVMSSDSLATRWVSTGIEDNRCILAQRNSNAKLTVWDGNANCLITVRKAFCVNFFHCLLLLWLAILLTMPFNYPVNTMRVGFNPFITTA